MKIIILAAGIGSRLGNPFPKPLTPLKDGKSIMQRQIDNITTYFDVNDITCTVLVETIQQNFKFDNCLSANNEKEKEANQIKLNTSYLYLIMCIH